MDTDWSVYRAIANTMCNAIPNDAGIEFKSDIEASPYWGGKFSPEQIKQMLTGELDWKEVFEDEVKKKLANFGIEYETGMFEEADEEEVPAILAFAKEGIDYKIGALAGDSDDSDEEVAV